MEQSTLKRKNYSVDSYVTFLIIICSHKHFSLKALYVYAILM